MTITKRLLQTAGLAAGVVGVVAASAPESVVGRNARRLADRLARDVRYAVASSPGILYRLAGREPDPNVSDDVLADRIRSTIGPVEKRLDVPRVHIFVEDHVAVVHGDVPDAWAARMVEHAIMNVSGVRGVESHLHCGLAPGDTRPSRGAEIAEPPSPALEALLEAARDAGANGNARPAVHAVLCAFGDRMPAAERDKMFGHLPSDVRAIAGPVHRHGERPARLRTVPQLVAAVVAEGGIEPAGADRITRAVVAVLHGIVPEDARDIAGVLPADLRELWETAPVGRS